MENDAEQLKSRFMATSRPTNIRDSHVLRPLISEEVISEAGEERRVIVAKYCYSDAVKPEAGRGEPDSHGSQAGELISKDFKGGPYMEFLHFGRNAYLHFDDSTTKEAISLCNDLGVSAMSGKGETCQSTEMGILESESNTCHDDGSTASDRVLGGTRLVAKFIGSEPGLYLESGEGETFQSTELGVLESESNDSTARGLGSTRVGAKFIDSQPGRIHLAADEGEPYPRTDVGSPDSESNTSRYDGLATEEEAISLCHDIVSQAAIPMSGKGETYQRTDVRSLDSESNTHPDDGSTAAQPVLGGGTTTTRGSQVLMPGDTQEGEVGRAYMESVPADIVLDILSRVPAESVLVCKLVCTNWVTLIRGSNFANMHLTRQLKHLHDGDDNLAAKVEPCLFFACCTDDPDEFITLLFHGGQVSDRISMNEKYIYNQNLKRIYHPPMHNKPLSYHLVGSCNGLVCAFQHHHLMLDPIYICNPLTREYVYLPPLVVNKEDVGPDLIDKLEGEVNMYGRVACGFGYVRSTNEYKVVRIHYLDTYIEGNVEVYTLGSGCGWRAIGIVSYGLSTLNAGTYANDAIYWVSYNKVVAFDLAKEEFRLVSSAPPCLQNRQNEDTCGLVALGRHVCFYMDKLPMEIWSLTKSSDSEETWRMEFDIDYEAAVGSRGRNIQPILLAKNGVIIFLYAKSVLYGYDTKTKVLKMISNDALTDYFEAVEAVAHADTFVSLEAMGENSKRYTVRPRWVRTPWDNVIDELDSLALGEKIDTTRFRLR